MKAFFKNFSSKMEEKFESPIKARFLGFIEKHPEMFSLGLLFVMCLLFLFFGLGFYPLIDVDETRYAVMARDLINSMDWNSLMLNGVPFLEKPPLYFWIVGLSINVFKEFSEFAVRLPIALLSTFVTFFTYYVGKRVISRKFGLISAIVLLTSMFFLILSHIAILDMVLTVFMASTLYCGFLTHFCEDKHKKYFWLAFYIFAGLGFLAKGILAIAIPMVIMFVYNFLTKTAKEIFKPLNMIPGLLLFLAMIMPWHIVMYIKYGRQFIDEYIILHHFARFLTSESIGRERPFWYFIPVFFLGFLPWSFIFIAFLTDGFKKLVAKFKSVEGNLKAKICGLFDVQTNEQKMLLFVSIYFVVTFVVFSISSTKLPTYILPVFPAAALMTGYFWWISDEKSQNQKAISIATQVFAGILIIGGVAATIAYFLLPPELLESIGSLRSAVAWGLYLLGMFLLLRINTKRAMSVFSGYIMVMLFVIFMSVTNIFTLVYNGGENEIVDYSGYAQIGPSRLVTFDFAVKPSAMIQYKGKVDFLTDADFDKLDEVIKNENRPVFVIVKNKNLRDKEYLKKIQKRLDLFHSGKKYSLYLKDSKKK